MQFLRKNVAKATDAVRNAAGRMASTFTQPVEEVASAVAEGEKKGNFFTNKVLPIGVGVGGVGALVYGGSQVVSGYQEDVARAENEENVYRDIVANVPQTIAASSMTNPNVDPVVTSAVFANYIEKQQAKEDEYARKLALARMQRDSMDSQYGGAY
jgi:hypothetical protein